VNVLLISPAFPDTFWSFKHALKFIRKRSSLPPLGLLTVAAMLPESWNQRLCDLNVTSLRDEDLEWADLALVSAMAVQRDSARAVLARCREAGVPIVAGGPLFTCEPEEFPEADHLVLNEAEVTLPAFLRDLEQGTPQRVYTSTELPDIRSTPAPRWDLADLRRYASMSVQFCRGCPFDCEFCNVTSLFGHRPRTKTPEQIVAELDALYALGWRGRIFFVDDNLIGNKRQLRELLAALIEWRRGKSGCQFYTEASINLADDAPLMQMMVDAGFDTVFVGIETPDEAALTECRKKQNTRRDLVRDVKRIQRAGMQVQGGFIVGFDSDTPSIFERQIEFIQKSGIVTAMVGLLQAPPGTKLYQRMKNERRLLGPMLGDNVDGGTNIIPRMNVDALKEGHARILKTIYSPESYYRRMRTFLREYRPPRIRPQIRLEHFLTSMRVSLHLGVLSKERFHYWRLLAWTALRRPALLSTAVTLAVNGYHCRKVCEQYLM